MPVVNYYRALKPSIGNPLCLLQGIPMLALTTEADPDILIDWLQDNINCCTPIVFDNDEDNTDSAALLP